LFCFWGLGVGRINDSFLVYFLVGGGGGGGGVYDWVFMKFGFAIAFLGYVKILILDISTHLT